MDYILELILKNEDHQLDKILSEQATKRGSNPLELTINSFRIISFISSDEFARAGRDVSLSL